MHTFPSAFTGTHFSTYAWIAKLLSLACQKNVRALSRLGISSIKAAAITMGSTHFLPVAQCAETISDNALTFARRSHDTSEFDPSESRSMLIPLTAQRGLAKCALQLGLVFCAALSVAAAQDSPGHNVPLISGGVGFVTSTNGGSTTYIPVISPVLAAPIGNRILVESRAIIIDPFSPQGGSQPGYKGNLFLGLTYLQADFVPSEHFTLVGGEFLTPFGTYNERLTPIWIGNFQDAPLIYSIGTMGSASSVGGMMRGSIFSNAHVQVDYAAYFSANSTNQQFSAERSSGGRGSLYFPTARLELGGSLGRRLQGDAQDFEGVHVWWEPANTSLRLRSEYARGPHSRGYWVEADYRLSRFNGGESFVGRFEPVFRMQQTFRTQADASDGLPAADTKQGDFGLDYRLPHEVRINSSYSREFSSTGNRNIWQTGIVYRFLFPTWRGK